MDLQPRSNTSQLLQKNSLIFTKIKWLLIGLKLKPKNQVKPISNVKVHGSTRRIGEAEVEAAQPIVHLNDFGRRHSRQELSRIHFEREHPFGALGGNG